jgi:formylglycine-generating enzyme required for sulfatase activity
LTETAIPTPTSSPIEITDAKGVKMALVPAGEFTMGSNKYNEEKPVHHFYVNDFYMDIYEVTNELYKACVTAGTCTEPGVTIRYDDLTYASHPVMYVDWNQAKAYCEWRGGRLPTEAEWEKAARGMGARTYPWGEGLDAAFANYGTNVGDTTEVGIYEMGKSPYGIYDMAGNVQEWVSSLFMNYPYNAGDGREDLTAPGMRIFRGGAWNESALLTRSASRVGSYPYAKNSGIGFRCARDATP